MPDITVMTWNVYVGARIEAVLEESDPELVPLRVAEAWAAVQATNFAERAAAIASEIAAARPHLVGLQEVSLFRLRSHGDVPHREAAGPATEVVLDFLAILLAALEEAEASYRLAARVENFDLEAPILSSPDGLDAGRRADPHDAMRRADYGAIRLTDYDVILARSDVATSHPRSGAFQAHRPLCLAGTELAIRRGWVSVDAFLAGRTHRFLNTHLEPADAAGLPLPDVAPIQAAQAAELRAELDRFAGPTIMVGDLNSAATGATTPTYADLVEGGFADVWLLGADRREGFTSNQDADLRNPDSRLFHRIDYVLYRHPGSSAVVDGPAAVDARLVGADPAARTTSGLWPSDHAGVLATLRPIRP